MIVKLFKGLFVYGGINSLQKSISILLVPLYLAKLSPQEYGQLEISLAIYAFISHLFMLQLEAGFQRFYFENDKNKTLRKQYLSSHLILAFVSSTIGAILVFSLNEFILLNIFQGESISKFFFIFFGFDLASRSLTSLLLIALRFKDKKTSFGIGALSDTIITFISATIFLAYFNLGLMGIFLAQFVGSFFSNIYMIYCLKTNLSFSFNFSIIKQSIIFSLNLLPGVMIGWSLSHFSRIFMSTSGIELADIAIYGLAFKFSAFAILALNAFKLVWQPISIKLIHQPGSKKFYSKIFDYYVLIILIISAIITILMKPILSIIAPLEFMSSAIYGPIILASTILNCSTIILGMGISISKKTIYNSIVTILAATSNLIIMIYGIDSYGIKAIAVAYFVSSAIVAYLTLIFSQKLYFIPYKVYTHFSMIFCCLLISIYPIQIFNMSTAYYKLLIVFSILLIVSGILEFKDIKKIKSKMFTIKNKK